MPRLSAIKLKKDRTVVTIECRKGQLVRVTTLFARKARDRHEVEVVPYNALATLRPVPSIWSKS